MLARYPLITKNAIKSIRIVTITNVSPRSNTHGKCNRNAQSR
jgi:hypothetical protein